MTEHDELMRAAHALMKQTGAESLSIWDLLLLQEAIASTKLDRPPTHGPGDEPEDNEGAHTH